MFYTKYSFLIFELLFDIIQNELKNYSKILISNQFKFNLLDYLS